MDNTKQEQVKHLAWHETLEIHELVAYQANHLIEFKMMLGNIKNPQLHGLYSEAITSLENNLRELLAFFPEAPKTMRSLSEDDLTAYYAGQLLGFAKTAVRNYAIAITETATPKLREILQKQLNHAIALHAKVFQFMYERGFYPSYNLNKLLANDAKQAKLAINLPTT